MFGRGRVTMAIVPILAALLCAVASAAVKEDVGFNALLARLGAGMPTGAGIDAAQIEAPRTVGGDDYFPADSPEYNESNLVDKTGTGTPSGHARNVGIRLYGTVKSMSPAMDDSIKDIYSVNDWLNNYLKVGKSPAPVVETRDIQVHPWVGDINPASDTLDIEAIRRLDYMVRRDNVVSIVGLGNDTGPVPDLLANAYNVIVAGVTSGQHSRGGSTVDGAGRIVPHLVVPEVEVSWGVGWVGSATALLLETANNDAGLANASRAVTVKALLMGGATKEEFGGSWSRNGNPAQPLDQVFGAGEMNINNSHRILEAGEQEASGSATVTSTGWDFDSVSSAASKLYFFDLADTARTLSVMLVWEREITDNPGGGFNPVASLGNLDLAFYEASGFTLGTMIDQSISTLDNVEHVYQQYLAPGRYAIEVWTDLDWDYALTWDALLALPGDANADGVVNFADFQILQNHWHLTGVGYTEGDFNNDMTVDLADFTILQDHWGESESLAAILAGEPPTLDDLSTPGGSSASVPEPATALILLGSLPLLLRRRPKR